MQEKQPSSIVGYRSPWRLASMEKPAPVLLALSGGADSRCLLHVLAKEAEREGYPLTLAHVNHGIRGEEALRDRDFCISLAREYGLELCILDADIPTLCRESGRSIEEEARLVRYGYFEQLMRERKIPLLVTAHHADDQLETVLFHLSRGSGLRGLGGISPARPFGGGMLVRPLLEVSRAEVLRYCTAHGLSFVTDSTNADVTYARNRIRTQVIPVMESLFSDPQTRTARMCESLREDEDYLSSAAEMLLGKLDTGERLPVASLSELHPALGKRVLIRWLEKNAALTPQREPLTVLWELLKAKKSGARVCFGEALSVSVGHTALRLEKGRSEATAFHIPVTEGELVLADSGIRILVTSSCEGEKIHNLSTTSTINLKLPSAMMDSGLYWRSRGTGDSILMGGMHRRVRKLHNAAHVPVYLRERLPLLCDGEGILWAPFLGMRDGAGEGEFSYCLQVVLPEPMC